MKIKCENGEIWISAIGAISLEEAKQLAKDLLALVAHEEAHARQRSMDRSWDIATDLEINDQCAGLYEDTPMVVDGETVGQWAGGGMSPEAYLKYIEKLEELDKED